MKLTCCILFVLFPTTECLPRKNRDTPVVVGDNIFSHPIFQKRPRSPPGGRLPDNAAVAESVSTTESSSPFQSIKDRSTSASTSSGTTTATTTESVSIEPNGGMSGIVSVIQGDNPQQTHYRRPGRTRAAGQRPSTRRIMDASSSSSSSFDQRTLQQQQAAGGAESMCQSAIPQEEEAGVDFGTQCFCTPNPSDRTSTMTCTDTLCGYCNNDHSVCERYSYGVVFDNWGQDVAYFEKDEYIRGKLGTVTFQEDENGCSIQANDETCTTCDMVDCEDGYYGVEANCQNLPSGGVHYNSCIDGFYTEGILQAFNQDEFQDCSTSLDICERELDDVAGDRFDCSCIASRSRPEVYYMDCSDDCVYCIDDDLCGQESFSQTYASAVLQSKTTTFEFTSGQVEKVEYKESDCLFSGCRTCTVKVDDTDCDSCSMQTCPNGDRLPVINCENVEPGVRANFCVEGATSRIFEFLSPDFEQSNCNRPSEMACTDDKAYYEESGELDFVCRCEITEDNQSLLDCKSTCGDLCNEERDVCVRESFQKKFGADGTARHFEKTMKYTLGRRETLTYFEDIDGSCGMAVDNQACQGCEIQTCPDGFVAPKLDCSNIEPAALLDLCNDTLKVDEGAFERISMDEFRECIDRTPTNMGCSSSVSLPLINNTVIGSTILVEESSAGDSVQSCAHGNDDDDETPSGLWYHLVGSGETIQASLCGDKTDFDAAISIYTGACSDLSCLIGTTNDNLCNVTWAAELDIDYYLHVHGRGIDQPYGNFQLVTMEVDACEALKVSMESSLNKNYTCACSKHDEPADDEITLQCENHCRLCKNHGSTCASEQQSFQIDVVGNVHTIRESFQYNVGRSEQIIVEKRRCTNGIDCAECTVSVDGTECESCHMVDCGGQIGNGVAVSCTIDGVQTLFNACSARVTRSSSTLFEVLLDDDFDACFSQDGWSSCEAKKASHGTTDNDIVCDCAEDGSEEGNVQLSCVDEGCLRCNESSNVCGHRAFGSTFAAETGIMLSQFEGFQYVGGRADSIAFHTPERGNGCRVTIDGIACDHCERQSCDGMEGTNPLLQYSVSCQNLPSGQNVDACDHTEFRGSFEFLELSFQQQDCVPGMDPGQACLQAMNNVVSTHALQELDCVCQPIQNHTSNGYNLQCADEVSGCHFCDERGDLCANSTEYGALIDKLGSIIWYSETYDYMHGEYETFTLQHNHTKCTALVGGIQCGMCEVVDCGANVRSPADDILGRRTKDHDYSIDCSNVLGHQALYQCGHGHSIFSPISGSMQLACPDEEGPAPNFDSAGPSLTPSSSTAAFADKPKLDPAPTHEHTENGDSFGMGIDTSGTLKITVKHLGWRLAWLLPFFCIL